MDPRIDESGAALPSGRMRVRSPPAALAGALWLVATPLAAWQQAPRAACPDAPGPTVRVLLEGTVRDEGSGVPLPGALVQVRYEEMRGRATPPEVSAQTDRNGRYRVCGLEAFRVVKVRASYHLRRGDERTVVLEASRTSDLEVDLGKPAFLVFSVAAADGGAPIEGASVEIAPLPLQGLTDARGRVAFGAVPPGSYELRVRHIAFEQRGDPISIEPEQQAELRVELRTQAIAVEPIAVQVTGRDPYLLTSGFYERRERIGEDGYFATRTEIRPYRMLKTLLQYKREFFVRFRGPRVVLLNGRPASRLGYTERDLNEIPFHRIRGIESYDCAEAPADLQRWIGIEAPLGRCILLAIWTR